MSSEILISSNDQGDNGGDSNEDHITKKVSFKETIEDTVENMVVDLSLNVVPVEAISKHGSGVDPFFDGIRGQFARMVVFVYLEKPLVSQILTIGKLQRVEFESLLAICFSYGCYGHLKDVYLYNGSDMNSVAGKE
ncbi:hypothetical protein Godav_017400 [Gossypium davidsonii]|uniref:Uncharacterized protein n=1 Tax=Gossypium davidsonii TaxID=34287 RepID=A0A7J8QT76_GOSDV|nr:hypothetical protein [Gossypium davidsonii]